ncbi:MAG TPA: MoxR family ATPase [Dehalococcoidia bacterium]
MAREIAEAVQWAREQGRFIGALKQEIARVIVGQEALIDRLLVGLLCQGHILVEGVPGLAKTLTVATLARATAARFVRIQFTPDLLPADLTGTVVYDARTARFDVHKGPIFAHLVLADEVNRAPAKVQSALLEAMQERQVSIGGETFPLPSPFMVMATQNPIEHEGTHPLPEAQLDRFMLKVVVGYPGFQEEREILERGLAGPPPDVRPVTTPEAVLEAQAAVRAVRVVPELRDYIVHLVTATRDPARYGMPDLVPLIAFGASPRAAVFLAQAAQAYAFIHGRTYVVPEDVKAMAPDVLRHRVILTYEAEAEEVSPEAVIDRVLTAVEVP